MSNTFRTLRVYEEENERFVRKIEERLFSELPEGDVLVKVKFAALNYKDALSATGNKGVTRKYPHTPGIDAAGIVAESKDPNFKEGDEVIVTSYDLGMNTDGGFGEYIRVPASWVVSKPDSISLKESMVLGTAGITAGIGLYKMEKMGQSPNMGSIVVTGATGGVGSMAVGMLAKIGYDVIASTGKEEAHTYLKNLGAKEIVDRDFVNEDSSKPLIKPKWAGGFDTVGGNTLATLLKGCKFGGSVTSCGLVSSPVLPITVFPFILNGINLLGIDSANFPMEERKIIWENLSGKWKIDNLNSMANVITLDDLEFYIQSILKGEVSGRVIVAFI